MGKTCERLKSIGYPQQTCVLQVSAPEAFNQRRALMMAATFGKQVL